MRVAAAIQPLMVLGDARLAHIHGACSRCCRGQYPDCCDSLRSCLTISNSFGVSMPLRTRVAVLRNMELAHIKKRQTGYAEMVQLILWKTQVTTEGDEIDGYVNGMSIGMAVPLSQPGQPD